MIKKIAVLIFLLSITIQATYAAPLEIEKVEKKAVLISELDNPAVFDFIINNSDGPQKAEIYSFVGISFEPAGFFDLSMGQNELEVKVYPNEEIRLKEGNFGFAYEIKGGISGITKDTIAIKIVGLKDLLNVRANDLNVGNDKINLVVTNTQNTDLENANIHFTSSFFDEQKSVSLKPFESVNLSLNIDKEKIKSLVYGSYVFNSEISLGNSSAEVESTLNYASKEESSVSKTGKGFIIRKTTYTRTNTGNTALSGKIEITKDVLSRLFTTNSAAPLQVERQSFSAKYIWEKSLQPGESYSIISTTNYTFPFILILLIVVVALLVKLYVKTNLVVDKRVSYVKTKGGEFALKVKLHVKAKKYIENVQLIDRLPGMTRLYEKFGVMPDKIDAATKRLFWNVERLNAGEERVYSYIIYSKVRVVGRFELPAATATYLREGKTEQVFSNRTFFVAETGRTDGNWFELITLLIMH